METGAGDSMIKPDEAFRRLTRRFATFFGFLETVTYLLFTLTFPGIIVFGMMYIAAIYDGFIAWAFGLALLTPIIAVWYWKMERRIRNYVDLLRGQGKFKWNIDKAVSEYQQILAEQKQKKKK